ncbi:unnamed protein product [Zygosaccharomyces bailii CLIB 213]|uniref:Tyrosine-protein phosphatase 2 n=1 Tax=Zygosaccharomyces bailii (strain CLIB 213 / ATCC 58445 / CBS 680 / BCRC 21525 / NBRC 1098 / NCYC 1416 / NRRL Y-2227) TaxID=1333698 RepID=A0A8J2T8W4_ZYGB2|nr:unnamed protein product [Zygosaccharomyces bailii CLIB 213]
MAVVACDHHRMAEGNANANGIGNGRSNSNGGSGVTTTQVMESRGVNPVNIYSANNVIRTATTNAFATGVGIPRVAPREGLKGNPFPFLGARGKETVNLLSSKDHHIDELESCYSVKEVRVSDHLADKTILIFDLTTNGFLLSSAAAKQAAKPEADSEEGYPNLNGDVYRIHLSLPSTLVKRPKFDFDKLLQTVIDDSKRLKLINLIENCSTFLFYDGSSKISSCGLPTYFLIKKFSAFLHEQLGKNRVHLYILEKMDKPVGKGLDSPKDLQAGSEKDVGGDNNDKNKIGNTQGGAPDCPPKKLNLSIKILPKTTDKMFIQSIKKDTVHYSPNSLKKFFKFHIPQELDNYDECLPSCLRPFCDRANADSILQKLLSNFEYLEGLELKRLEKGLTTESNHDQRNLQDSASYHKIYSLSNLQKEFRKQKKATSSKQTSSPSDSASRTSSPVDAISNLKVCIPPPSNVLTKVDTNHLSPHVDTDSSDSMLTPMDSYELSQGIQAFTKNRYSNILPYEHSRVKLQASPISGPNGGMTFTHQNNSNNNISGNSNGNNSTSGNNNSSANNKGTYNSITVKAPGHGNDTERTPGSNTRKRRSSSLSYFNQGIGAPQREKEQNKADAPKEKFNDYFNANYLKIPQVNADYNYIATQAPLPSTVDDFWKVISTNQVKVIISLNSTDELYMRKWDIYWNNNRSNRKYTIDIVDVFENACNVEGCILRVFKFYKIGEQQGDPDTTTVYQLQYTKWLDSCGIVMEDIVSLCRIKNMLLHNPTELFLDLKNGSCKGTEKYSNEAWIEKLNGSNSSDYSAPKKQSPLLVHCSAGCGRTGVFITLDFILNVLMEPTNARNSIDVWNMSQDLIFITVNELRKQRISMVQNLTQYITCYESILEFFAFQKRRKSSHMKTAT